MCHLRGLLALALVLGICVVQNQGGSLRRTGQLRHRTASDEGVVVCSICPDAVLIEPCTCICHNATSADIRCGPELTSCEELTDILNVATPVSQYLRLVVQKTSLQCMLTNDIWGPTTFQEILLVENQFSIVDNHAFAHFNKSMKLLDLHKNRLQDVCFSTFNNQPHVEIINLNDNKINFIPGLGNMEVKELREIHLRGNSLKTIMENTYQLMPKLQVIDYSHNMISTIDPGAFAFNTRFNDNRLTINLTNNLIEKFRHDAISGIQNVTLNLKNNKIQDLSEFYEVLQDTNFKAKIFLNGNPIICDAQLCWIVQNKTIMSHFDDFECTDSALTLYSLSPDYLGCSM
ncbi:leucine-rich repeat-containing protein 15-like [Macrobrachium nipponense]|uniref:leucine-rich repeat-containing protein 15-like n=1 Tax=Macrobrachium nipponense TaxID=159736 RepID=UPI0030C81BBE